MRERNILLVFFLLFACSSPAINPIFCNIPMMEQPVAVDELTLSVFAKFKKKGLNKGFGRLLSFKEDLGFFFMKRCIKGAIMQDPSLGEANSSLSFDTCQKVVLKNGHSMKVDISQIILPEVRCRRVANLMLRKSFSTVGMY